MSDLRKAAQALVDRWDTPLWKEAPHTGTFIDALRAALAQPEPPLSIGGWFCSPSGSMIFHDDFELDAILSVSGDFVTDERRIEFAQMVTKTLNAALAQPERKPLTNLEMCQLCPAVLMPARGAYEFALGLANFARAIERAHGIGGEA